MDTGGNVTVFEGAAFCRSSRGGDLEGGADGWFTHEARFLSRLVVRVDGERPEPLGADVADPHRAAFVARRGERLVLERHRVVAGGLRDELVLRNVSDEAVYASVEVEVAADFAGPDEVRRAGAGVPIARPLAEVTQEAYGLLLTEPGGSRSVRVRVVAGDRSPACVGAGTVLHEAIVPARGSWPLLVSAEPLADGRSLGESRATAAAEAGERLARWRRSLPVVRTDHAGLAAALQRALDDLGALRLFDPAVPERPAVAAGLPWSMALHGRDALLTAWMALMVDPDLAIGVLETLAQHQGTADDARTEEEPGRILRRLGFDGSRPDYGAVDTTPLFVMLLGELRRWGLAPELVERLLPHADAALTWLDEHGDRDGDGWVEYRRRTDKGARHQSWRDSDQGWVAADGRVAQPPIASAEVQALHYAALVARSHFAREAGDAAGAAAWRARADDLRVRFRRDFWLEDRGHPALGLDHEKRQIDALGSHLGWCLWTGVLDPAEAASVAKLLISDDLFTGWGVRSLAASTVGWHPLGHHHGAVWPHDTAIAAAGLMRYGFVDESLRLIGGLLDAAAAFGGRLPELFAGFGRTEVGFPVPVPEACAPSAWAAASVLLAVRTMLRLDPWVPAGRIHLAPVLPPDVGSLSIEHIPLLGGRLSVSVAGGEAEVAEVPPGIEVVWSPRRATRTH